MQAFKIKSESLGFDQTIYGYEAPKPEAVFDLMKQSVPQEQMLGLFKDGASEADKSIVRDAVRYGFFDGEGSFSDGFKKAVDDVFGGLQKLPQSSERDAMLREVLNQSPGSYEQKPRSKLNMTENFMRDFGMLEHNFATQAKDTTEIEKKFDADTLAKVEQASIRLMGSATDLSNQSRKSIWNAKEEMIRALGYYDLPQTDEVRAMVASKAMNYSQKQSKADMFQGFANAYVGYKMLADLGIKAYDSPSVMNPFTNWRDHTDDQIDSQINFLQEQNKAMVAMGKGARTFAEISGDIDLYNDLATGRIKPDQERALMYELAGELPEAVLTAGVTSGVVAGKNVLRKGAVTQLTKEATDVAGELARLKDLKQKAIKQNSNGSLDTVIDGLSNKEKVAQKNLDEIYTKFEKKTKAGSNVMFGNKIMGRTAQAVGGTAEVVGRTLQFLKQVGPEMAKSFIIKKGLATTEQGASEILSKIGYGAVGAGALYTATTDDSSKPLLYALGFALGPKVLEDIGRSVRMYGEEALKMDRIMPYFKRLGQSPVDNPTPAGAIFDRESVNYGLLETASMVAQDAFRKKNMPGIGKAVARGMEYVPGTGAMNRIMQGGIAGASVPMAMGYGLGGAEGAGAGLGTSVPFIAVGGAHGELKRYTSENQLKLKQLGQVKEYESGLTEIRKKQFKRLAPEERTAIAEISAYFPDVVIDYIDNPGGTRGQYTVQDGQGHILINTSKSYDKKGSSVLDAILAHEIGHYVKSHNLHHVINDALLGSVEKGTTGFFTKLDENGKPIIDKSDPLNSSYVLNDQFAKYAKATEQDVNKGKASYVGERILVGGIKKQYMDKLRASKGVDPGTIARYENDDRLIAEEYFAEHQADRILTGKTRRIAMQGPYGRMFDSIGNTLLNSKFVKKLGLSLGGKMSIDGSKLIFFDKEKGKSTLPFNKALDEISKEFERKTIGRTKEEIDREYGENRVQIDGIQQGEFEVRPQDYGNMQAMEHFNNGGVLDTNPDGSLKTDNGKAVLLSKKQQDQRAKSQANNLIELIQRHQRTNPEGLPDGHVTLYETADGRLRGTGRYLDPRIIDELEDTGLYNEKQINFLRMASDAGRKQQPGIHQDANENPEFFYDSFGNATRNPDYDPDAPLGDFQGPPKNQFLMMYYKAMGRDRRYKTIRGAMRDALVYGITVTKDANIIIDTIDRHQLEKNVDHLLKSKSRADKAMREFNIGDAGELKKKILSDLIDYTTEHHKNIVTGSDESKFTKGQSNILNSAFGALRKSQIDLNPVLEGLGDAKSQRMASARSRRLDRIANMNPFGDGMHLHIRKIQNVLNPSPSPSPMAMLMPDDGVSASGKNKEIARDNSMFMPADEAFDYRGSHRAPDREYGAPLSELTPMYPDDVYSQAGFRYYTDGGIMAVEAMDIAHRMRGKPDEDVTVYRAIPGEAMPVINPGDWVTTVREYAELHGEHINLKNPTIVEQKVPAGDLFTEGNSILEYGYDPGAHIDSKAMFMPADIKDSQPLQRQPGPQMLGVDFFYNDKVVLIGPYPVGRAPARNEKSEPIMRGRFQIFERSEFDKANAKREQISEHGYVEGSITDDGFFDALIDIRINKGVRKKGLGTDVVHSLAHHALDGEMLVKDIQASAKKFWQKIGSEDFKPFTESGYKTRTEAKLKAPGATRSLRPTDDQGMLMPDDQGELDFRSEDDYLGNLKRDMSDRSLGLQDALLKNLYPKLPGRVTITQLEQMIKKDPALVEYNKDTKILDKIKSAFGGSGKINKSFILKYVDEYGPRLVAHTNDNFKGTASPDLPGEYSITYYQDGNFKGKPYRKNVHQPPANNIVFHERKFEGAFYHEDADGNLIADDEYVVTEAQSDPHQDARKGINDAKPVNPETNPKVGYRSDADENLQFELEVIDSDIRANNKAFDKSKAYFVDEIIPQMQRAFNLTNQRIQEHIFNGGVYNIKIPPSREIGRGLYNRIINEVRDTFGDSPNVPYNKLGNTTEIYDMRGFDSSYEIVVRPGLSSNATAMVKRAIADLREKYSDIDILNVSTHPHIHQYKPVEIFYDKDIETVRVSDPDGRAPNGVDDRELELDPLEERTVSRLIEKTFEAYEDFVGGFKGDFLVGTEFHPKQAFYDLNPNIGLEIDKFDTLVNATKHENNRLIKKYRDIKVKLDRAVSIDTYKKWVPKVIKAGIRNAIKGDHGAYSILSGEQIGMAETMPSDANGIIYKKNENGRYDLSVTNDQGNGRFEYVVDEVNLTPQEVVNYVGKDIFARYIEPGKGVGRKEKTLQLGGKEGDIDGLRIIPNLKPFRSFYDGEMVKTTNKIAKKMGLKPMEYVPPVRIPVGNFSIKFPEDYNVTPTLVALEKAGAKFDTDMDGSLDIRETDRLVKDPTTGRITNKGTNHHVSFKMELQADRSGPIKNELRNDHGLGADMIEPLIRKMLEDTKQSFGESVIVKFEDKKSHARHRLSLFPEDAPKNGAERFEWRHSPAGEKWFNDLQEKMTLHMPDDTESSGPPQSGSALRQHFPEAIEVKQAVNEDGSLKFKPKEDADGNPEKDENGNPILLPVYDTIGYDLEGSPVVQSFTGKKGTKINYDVDGLDYINNTEKERLKKILESGALDESADRLEESMTNWLKDPEIQAGDGWYSRMRTKLSNALGNQHEIFAQLLGATSANTPVEENFMQAIEALELHESGKYDQMVKTYIEGYNAYKDGTIAKMMYEKGMATKKEVMKKDNTFVNSKTINKKMLTRWVAGKNASGRQVRKPLVPLRKNGKKFNKNSGAVMRVLAGSWLSLGSAPKTPNFAGNLTGRTLQATIDVWAGRLLRRLMYQGQSKWRIQPASETGVTNIDFAIGQIVFDEVGKRMKKNPDDLQAIAWFGEKDLWGKNNWTGDTGEFKSSFDEPFEAYFPPGKPRESHKEGAKIIEYHRAKRNKSKWEKEKANPGMFLKKSGKKYTLDETKTKLKDARSRFNKAKNKDIVRKFLSGTR